MTGIVFTVQPGAGQQFTGAPLQNGATVWNRDSANSIWISSDRNVFPGNGLELPPAASCDWTGSQLFACLDTGGTKAVSLQVSNDVQGVTDPVGVAEAIALIGIPNVLVDTIVENQVVVPLGSPLTISTAGYSALDITIADNDSLFSPFAGRVIQSIAAAGNAISDVTHYQGTALAGGTTSIGFTIPVLGDTVEFIPTLGNQKITVVGTNRSIPKPVAEAGAANLTTTTAVIVIGTSFPLVNVATDGGLVQWAMSATAAGSLFYQFYDDSGTAQSLLLALIPNTNVFQYGQAIVPLGRTTFLFFPTASVNPASIQLSVLGQQGR